MISVVVCAKDEPLIGDCLRSIRSAHGGEIVVVCADEPTAALARRAVSPPFIIVTSVRGSLPADRQVGADLSNGDLVAFIDADHRVQRGDLSVLVDELRHYRAGVVQARLAITPRSFWNRAESEFLDMTMVPGPHDMVGVAPAVFRREVLDDVRFADGLSIDDTDFMYRLHRDTDHVTAVSCSVIECEHAPRLRDYWAKWSWYGRGDREFMVEHPERRASMLFHLLVRYPLIHPARAIASGRFRAAPYAFLQGVARAIAALT